MALVAPATLIGICRLVGGMLVAGAVDDGENEENVATVASADVLTSDCVATAGEAFVTTTAFSASTSGVAADFLGTAGAAEPLFSVADLVAVLAAPAAVLVFADDNPLCDALVPSSSDGTDSVDVVPDGAVVVSAAAAVEVATSGAAVYSACKPAMF